MASTWDAKSSEFCEKSKPFPKGHAFFEFDVKKNSKRLKILKKIYPLEYQP